MYVCMHVCMHACMHACMHSFVGLKLDQLVSCFKLLPPPDTMVTIFNQVAKVEVLAGEPFLFDADGVNNVGACNKACYIAMSWLLNKACYESKDGAAVLEHTMPDGGVKQLAIPHQDPIFPWQHVRSEGQ